MPIFEYQCARCGNEFEWLSLPTSPLPECPSCHSQDLTKLLSLSMVSSPATKLRAYQDYERRDSKMREEKARSDDHHHDH